MRKTPQLVEHKLVAMATTVA